VRVGPVEEIDVPDVLTGQYLVATGSSRPCRTFPAGRVGVSDLHDAMDLPVLPESLLVVGGNAVGLEVAQLLAGLGSRVSVVEAMDRLAPFDEPEASQAIVAVFADEGITGHTATQVTAVHRQGGAVTARLRDSDGRERAVTASEVLGELPVPAPGPPRQGRPHTTA
jgi:mercuric reductase